MLEDEGLSEFGLAPNPTLLVFTCKNKLNIVNSVLFLIKGVYNGKKSANTLLFRE